MSDAAFIIGEIIIGIAVLGVLSAVVTDIMVRRLSPPPAATEIVRRRYALGELTRSQYEQMCQDLGMTATPGDGFRAAQANGQDVLITPVSRRDR